MVRALAIMLFVQAVAAIRRRELLAHSNANVDLAFNSNCRAQGSMVWTQYEQLQLRALHWKQEPDQRRMLVWTCASSGCGGIANQLRGIAVALLTAMVTGRSFFLHPDRSTFGPASWPEPNRIDWNLPNETSFSHCQSVNRMCARGGECDWAAVLEVEAPCILLETNSVPSQWWQEVMEKSPQGPKMLGPLQEAVGSGDFLSGCALRFLFDFSQMEREFDQAMEESDTLRPTSNKYVAIHMRMGDEYIHGSAEVNSADQTRMRAALFCARALGRKLFGLDQHWTVFFASDSSGMRELALRSGEELGIRVMDHDFEPVHTQCCEWTIMKWWGDLTNFVGVRDKAACHGYCGETPWDVWGDFLTLLHAQGLVSAGGATSAAGDNALDTRGLSDYSLIPTQYAFVPYENQWRVPPQEEAAVAMCVPVTPEDAGVIV